MSNPGLSATLVLGCGSPAVVSRDFSVVPDANSFVVSGRASMRIDRLAVKLSENGVVVDSTETTVSGSLVLADGHSFTTRDLHG